jgi:hypothetical protein
MLGPPEDSQSLEIRVMDPYNGLIHHSHALKSMVLVPYLPPLKSR